jgi:signal transduction histidine kinase
MRLKVEQAGERIAPELADELENELHRLTHVVDQSLLIARAEQGRLLPMRSVFNFSAAAAEVVGDFQLLAAEQNRKFTLLADQDCWVSADPRHLRQITHTLLTNALKHGSGDLTVRLKRRSRFAVLLVSNRVNRAPDRESTLGLGLRVVAALLRLEPELRLQRRHGKSQYTTLLRMPTAEQPLAFHI